MPKSKPPKSSAKSGTTTHLSKQDKIDELLKIQQETFPNKELSPEEINRWHMDLEPYRLEAIEWAFDNWRRNGHFFPVPGDILDQCEVFSPAIKDGRCDAECQARHGKGYGENDILWLWKRYTKLHGDKKGPLTEEEHQSLLNQLDAFRGESPAWR